MADRYDDTYPRRTPSAGRAPRPETSGAQEDPLVELARLVSGSENFDEMIGTRRPPQAQRVAPSAPASTTRGQPPRDASFDLESELLNDLQSSFDPPPARPATPRAAPASPPPEDRSFEAMRLRPTAAPPPPPAQPQSQTRYQQQPSRAPIQDEDPYAGTAYAGAAGFERYADNGRATGQRAAPPPSHDYYEDEPADRYGAQAEPADDYYDDQAYDDQGAYDDAGYEDEPPRRSRRWLVVVAAVLAVILAGGVTALMLHGGGTSSLTGDGTPRVIAADEGPTKVKPAVQPTTDDGQQNKLIYDRANPDSNNGDQLVMPNNGATDAAPASNESQGSREISRIILPGAPGDQTTAPSPGDTQVAAAPPSGETDVGPRRVRTVVVKPDGTIISSEAQPQGAAATQAPDAVAQAPSAPAQTAAPVVVDNSPPSAPPTDTTPPPSNPPPLAAPDNASTQPPKDDSQLAPAAKPATKPKSVAMAVPETRPAPADTASSDAGTSSGIFVQLTSQRTEDQAKAAYRALQRKFPSILGSREANIAQADLGAKGTYYRARIGPWKTRDDAASFCQDLRAAGGDCIIQK